MSFQSPPEKTKEAVKTAVKSGYRMIDCANDYSNEHVIGEALQELYAEGVCKRYYDYDLLSDLVSIGGSVYNGEQISNKGHK